MKHKNNDRKEGEESVRTNLKGKMTWITIQSQYNQEVEPFQHKHWHEPSSEKHHK
jgi:hypothetical protein